MIKKLIFLTALLTIPLLTFTSCQKKFDKEKFEQLSNLHQNSSDYTKKEIEEMETQLDLYMHDLEKRVDAMLSKKNESEKIAALYEFMISYGEDSTTRSISMVMNILQNNSYSNKDKLKKVKTRAVVVLHKVDSALLFQ